MAAADYEGGSGGKFRKPPLRGAPSTPYNRPEAMSRGVRRLPLAAEAGGNGWLSKIMDPASRVIANSVYLLFYSVFRKHLAAPPDTPGENLDTTEELMEMKSTPEVRELGGNAVYGRLPTDNDGRGRSEQEIISCTDGIFQLEQLLKQKKFTWAETERLKELLHSRTIELCTLKVPDDNNKGANDKNKGKVDEQSNVDPSSSQEAINAEEQEKANASELEDQREKLVKLHGNITSGVKFTIPEEGVGSPIEVARAYMGSKPLKVFSSTLGLHSQICNEDKALATNVTFGNKLLNVAIASRSSPCFPEFPADSENDYMTPKVHVRSALRPPYYRSPMITNSRRYNPYKESCPRQTRSLDWTTSVSNVMHSGHRQALKRDGSDSDAGSFDHTRRVLQKSSVKDMHMPACAYTPSTSYLGQGYREDTYLEGMKNIDGSILLASCIPVPSQSTETARKILHLLDKLVHSPRNKSSEKKVIVGNASSSKSSLNASNWGALDEPGSSSMVKIKTSTSPNKDTAKEQLSLKSSILGSKLATSCFHLNGAVTSASDAKHGMRSMDSTLKEPTFQNAPNDEIWSTAAENVIFSSETKPRERSLVHSPENMPTSGSIHIETSSKAHDNPSIEKEAKFPFHAACRPNISSKPLLSATIATVLADGATPKEEAAVSAFQFGLKGSASDATKHVNSSIARYCSVQTRETLKELPSSELDNGEFIASTGTCASSCMSAAPSSRVSGVSTPVMSSLYREIGASISLPTSSIFPNSAGGIFSFSASPTSGGSSSQFASQSSHIDARNIVATVALSSGNQETTTGYKFANFSQGSVRPFGSLSSQATFAFGSSSLTSSSSSQIGVAISVADPFTLSSFSSSAALSTSSFSLSPIFPASFSASNSISSSLSSFSATLNSTPSPSPSTSFSFGTHASVSIPLIPTSGSIISLASAGTTTSAAPTYSVGLGSGSSPNDQVNVDDTLEEAHIASGAQGFQFGTSQNSCTSDPRNSSPFQSSGNPGFSAGGIFSLGSGGGDKSERKFIRVRRDKHRRN